MKYKGFNIVTDEEIELFNYKDYSDHAEFFFRPIFKLLPDLEGMDKKEINKYFFKDIPEGFYFVGLEIISNTWINKGFCSHLFKEYGLILDETNPMQKIGNYSEEPMIFVRLEHILFDLQYLD